MLVARSRGMTHEVTLERHIGVVVKLFCSAWRRVGGLIGGIVVTLSIVTDLDGSR